VGDEEGEGEEAPSMHRCARLSDCPSRTSWTDPSAPGTKGMDGSQITCISDSLVCGAQRLVFPAAVINYDRNRRIRARIVGHAGRRRGREQLSLKLFFDCR